MSKTKKRPAAMEPPPPEWLDNTPDCSYRLSMYGPGSIEQEITLDREEYIALKHELAALRSYRAPKVRP